MFTRTYTSSTLTIYFPSAFPSPSSALLVFQLAIGFPVQSIVTSRGQKIQGEVSFNLMGHCFGFSYAGTHTYKYVHAHIYRSWLPVWPSIVTLPLLPVTLVHVCFVKSDQLELDKQDERPIFSEWSSLAEFFKAYSPPVQIYFPTFWMLVYLIVTQTCTVFVQSWD